MTLEDILKVVVPLFNSVKEKRETIDFFGRQVLITVKGRVHSLKEPWVYDGQALDMASGTKGEKKHLKSSSGAAEHALRDLYDKLKSQKLI